MNSRIKNIVRDALRRTPLRAAVMAYRHRGLNSDDVFLASYPRSGNTWIKSLVCSCISGEAMTNFSDTKDPLIPIVGYHLKVQPLLQGKGRLIKTHEAFRSEYQKAIWIVRDPRDVVVSEYRLALRTKRFSGSLSDYIRLFTTYPRSAGTNWGRHTQSWLDAPIAETSQLLTLQFEDLRTETPQHLERILSFVGIVPTPNMIEKAVAQNSIESMASRHSSYDLSLGKSIAAKIPAVNEGNTGGWRNSLSEQSLELLNNAFCATMLKVGYDPSPAVSPPERTGI